MLDAQTIATVKATIPLLVETGPKLTAHFYDRMFAHNPELKEIFNMSNQRNGDQREALFNAIAAYASNLENLPALLPAVEKIAQKHTSFQIKPEQYNIVGSHLLATLDEMFSPGQEVLDAWGKAYGVLANVFIGREAEIYQQNASKTGGWEGTRAFRIVKKTPRSQLITSFVLEPVDGQPVADAADAMTKLVAQMTRPVRWDLCTETMRQLNTTAIVEFPPAGALTGIAKRELRGVATHAIKAPADLDGLADL